MPGQRDHLVALGRGVDQIERALADRAGGAENGDAPPLAGRVHHGHGHIPRPSSSASAGAVSRNPSSRSSRPPCPGISDPLSLTPARRLSDDSARSPSCASSANAALSPAAWKRRSEPSTHRVIAPARLAPTTPPPSPDQVLPGLIAGASRGPPTRRPTA